MAFFHAKFPNNFNSYGNHQKRKPPTAKTETPSSRPKSGQNPLSVSVAEDFCQSDLTPDFARPRHNKSMTYATRSKRSSSTPARFQAEAVVPFVELPTSGYWWNIELLAWKCWKWRKWRACAVSGGDGDGTWPTSDATWLTTDGSTNLKLLSQTSLTSSVAAGKIPHSDLRRRQDSSG